MMLASEERRRTRVDGESVRLLGEQLAAHLVVRGQLLARDRAVGLAQARLLGDDACARD